MGINGNVQGKRGNSEGIGNTENSWKMERRFMGGKKRVWSEEEDENRNFACESYHGRRWREREKIKAIIKETSFLPPLSL